MQIITTIIITYPNNEAPTRTHLFAIKLDRYHPGHARNYFYQLV
uniref:Uncharacterized protein n=1 Tax=viral metagenome TaxID=1070528 RepID=A0A6C0C873_9ZZZZ